MNCKKVEGQLQELLDFGPCSPQGDQVQTHLTTCASCAGRYETLRLIVLSLKTLPLYQVGPRFNQKVLAALGHSVSRVVIPSWVKGTVASLLLLVSGWMTYLSVEGLAAMNRLKPVQALEFLLHPSRLSLLLKQEVVRVGLALIHFLSTWNGGRFPLESGLPWPQGILQVFLSVLLAGTLIAVISKNSRSKEIGGFA